MLIEKTDTEEMIEEVLGGNIENALCEPGFMKRDFFITCILENDHYRITVMIPDENWLRSKEREALREVCGCKLKEMA